MALELKKNQWEVALKLKATPLQVAFPIIFTCAGDSRALYQNSMCSEASWRVAFHNGTVDRRMFLLIGEMLTEYARRDCFG